MGKRKTVFQWEILPQKHVYVYVREKTALIVAARKQKQKHCHFARWKSRSHVFSINRNMCVKHTHTHARTPRPMTLFLLVFANAWIWQTRFIAIDVRGTAAVGAVVVIASAAWRQKKIDTMDANGRSERAREIDNKYWTIVPKAGVLKWTILKAAREIVRKKEKYGMRIINTK